MPRSNRRSPRHYRVTLGDLLESHHRALQFGGLDGVRDLGLVESAIARPYSGYYRSINAKAAVLTHSLAKNHGFVEGNKRTALAGASLSLGRFGDCDQDPSNANPLDHRRPARAARKKADQMLTKRVQN